MNLPSISNAAGGFAAPDAAPQATVRHVRADPDDGDEIRHAHRKRVASTGGGYHGASTGAVCVRLCDGFFFPAASSGAGDAGCASQCPGAPTDLYTMTSDRIDDAYATSSGAPYTKLPVAKHYQESREGTCSCHRDGIASHSKELLHDDTLRKGDVVMTADGFRVYEGSGWGSTKPQDFVAISKAGLSHDESSQLAAMEHASAGQVSPATPAFVEARPKGNVTVDNGTP